MRVLICAEAVPVPPFNGFRLHLFEICRELAADHSVCVIGYRWPDQSGSPPPGVEILELELPPAGAAPRRLARRGRAVIGSQPMEAAFLTPRLTEAVRRLLRTRSFDVAHVTGAVVSGVGAELAGLPAILVPLDAWQREVDNTLPTDRQKRDQGEAGRIRRYVPRAYAPYRRAVYISPEDAREGALLHPRVPAEVIPNGVDAARFTSNGAVSRPGTVVFTGSLDFAPNVRAAEVLARRIFPDVRAQRPDASLLIVGRSPHPAVVALGLIPGIEVVADVPDIRPWLWRADVYACPMISGTGMKNKLLEALATGRACVATPLACQGLAVNAGEHLLVAEAERGFAQAVVSLLDDSRRRAEVGAAGRRFVLEHHDWGRSAQAYADLYRRVVGEASRSGSAP